MANYRVAFVLLLLYGALPLWISPMTSRGAKACPLYCLDVEFMTCESSGDKKLNPRCNCCLAPKNCTLHLADGSSIFCKPA